MDREYKGVDEASLWLLTLDLSHSPIRLIMSVQNVIKIQWLLNRSLIPFMGVFWREEKEGEKGGRRREKGGREAKGVWRWEGRLSLPQIRS